MGLYQKALQAYDYFESCVGQKPKEKQIPLAPIGHSVVQAGLEITLAKGKGFRDAKVLDVGEFRIIPVTEDSCSRSGKDFFKNPHGLCDNFVFLSPNGKGYQYYLDQLHRWIKSDNSHPMLEVIYDYVSGGTIMDDLRDYLKIDATGHFFDPKIEKSTVVWRVYGDWEESECWYNQDLFACWTQYYISTLAADPEHHPYDTCMVSGEKDYTIHHHPKAIVPQHGNGKFISSNDTKGLTYRDIQFLDAEQISNIGFVSSQKIHNFLKWIIYNQNISFSDRYFIAWTENCVDLPPVSSSIKTYSAEEENPDDPSVYAKDLEESLTRKKQLVPSEANTIQLAGIDGSTDGRLSLVYYTELPCSVYFDRLLDWDMLCQCPDTMGRYASAKLNTIVSYTYGKFEKTNKSVKLVTNPKIYKQAITRLIRCKIEGFPFPPDIMRQLVSNAFHIFNVSFPKKETTSYYRNMYMWLTSCVIRKYHYDKTKEKLPMSLEPDRLDLNYQQGRAMAVLEKIELDYNRDHKIDSDPMATRLFESCSYRPGAVLAQIENHVRTVYLPKLNYRKGIQNYNDLLDQIYGTMSNCSDSPGIASESFLYGYHLQRLSLYKKQNDEIKEETIDECVE